jgi:hypothetical protein
MTCEEDDYPKDNTCEMANSYPLNPRPKRKEKEVIHIRK